MRGRFLKERLARDALLGLNDALLHLNDEKLVKITGRLARDGRLLEQGFCRVIQLLVKLSGRFLFFFPEIASPTE